MRTNRLCYNFIWSSVSGRPTLDTFIAYPITLHKTTSKYINHLPASNGTCYRTIVANQTVGGRMNVQTSQPTRDIVYKSNGSKSPYSGENGGLGWPILTD